MENYHENVMIYENSEYNGLENLSSIENTENIVLETLLLLGLFVKRNFDSSDRLFNI